MAGKDVEWNEVQGIVLSTYLGKRYTHYFLLTIRDPRAATRWLDELIEKTLAFEANRSNVGPWLSFGDDNSEQGPSLNIAFTFLGLGRLGLKQEELDTFPWDFRDGMTSPLRRRILADRGPNCPGNWEWGGDKGDNVKRVPDVLLMLYARGEELQQWSDSFQSDPRWQEAFEPLNLQRPALGGDLNNHLSVGYQPDDRREHFGFVDGLSQPAIETSPRARKFHGLGEYDAIVKPGEFILGYVNERGQLPVSPCLANSPSIKLPIISASDPSLSGNVRDGDRLGWPRLDFGRNGTFLVYRQLDQNVFAFNRLIRDAERRLSFDTVPRLSDEGDFRQLLAAKIIGRWDNGAPLVLEPRATTENRPDGLSNLRTVNTFGYADEDAYGLRCPIGAHIRRANPRDTLDEDPKHAASRNNRHRLLRRGRLYGRKTNWKAWERTADAQKPDGIERGLHFVAINASLESQFEFMQQSWMNTSFFGGLSDEVDPLIGVPESGSRRFTMQAAPLSRSITWKEPLVTVRGGAYFFLPSRSALAALAALHG